MGIGFDVMVLSLMGVRLVLCMEGGRWLLYTCGCLGGHRIFDREEGIGSGRERRRRGEGGSSSR